MLVRGGVHQCPVIPLMGGYIRFQVIEMWSEHNEIGAYHFREFERRGREETYLTPWMPRCDFMESFCGKSVTLT